MSNSYTDEYQDNLISRAEAVAEYFTSKPAEQIVLRLLAKAKKSNTNDDWERLESYVRELEGVVFQNEYRPCEVY